MRVFAVLVMAAGVVGCGGEGGSPSAAKDDGGTLSGVVTLAGQPVRMATVTVIAPNGKTANAPTNDFGQYQILNPPAGKLNVTVGSLAPPPPPGMSAPPQMGTVVPAKYAKPSGITVDYTGGAQTFDVTLAP